MRVYELFVSFLFQQAALIPAVAALPATDGLGHGPLNGSAFVAATGVVNPGVTTIPLRKQYVPISRNGSVIAYKTSYFGRVSVGVPEPQVFTVVFDTGSGHLILPNKACESETCLKHRRYDILESPHARDVTYDGKLVDPTSKKRDQLSVRFGTGEVVGQFVQDSVCLGPASEGNCTSLRILLANKMSEEPFGLFEFDGVLGLGLGALALTPQFSFFGQLTAQFPELVPHFAVYMAHTDEGQSAISFGGHDPRYVASELEWAPVAMAELGYWQVQIKAVYIGDTLLDYCSDGGCRAILDSGTSLLGVPRDVSRPMHSMLQRVVPEDPQDPAREEADCRHVPGAQMRFDLGGPQVILNVEDYSRPKPFNMTSDHAEKGWDLYCRSLLLPVDMKAPLGPSVFIWGEPVLRKYYTVYDWEEKRIGFAKSVAEPSVVFADSEGGGAIGSPPEGSRAAGAPLAARREAGPPKSGGASAPAAAAAPEPRVAVV